MHKIEKVFILKINNTLSDWYSETAAKSCQELGIPWEYFYGVEGLTQDEAYGRLPFKVELHHRQSDAAACVTVSHYLLWQKIAEQGIAAAIFEHDGIMLHSPIEIPDDHLVVLGYKSKTPKEYDHKTAGPPKELISINAHSGAHAYALTSNTATQLLEELKAVGCIESIDNMYFLRDKPEKVSKVPLLLMDPGAAIGWLRKSTVWGESWEFNYPQSYSYVSNQRMKIRLHVLGVPHTKSTREYACCAFTQKLLNSCEMFRAEGMEVIHYGHPDSEVDCDEHVPVVSRQTYDEIYGNQDWKTNGLAYESTGTNKVYDECFQNSIIEIEKRKQPGDFILTYWGGQQKVVLDAHPDLFGCEASIGYPSQFADFRVYESYAMLHLMSGPESTTNIVNNFYQPVIPSAFKLEQFEYRSKKEDFFLHIGRLGMGKGTHIAVNVCKHIGAELIILGTGSDPKSLGFEDGWPPNVKFLGYADVEKRKYYMSRAKGLFCPTLYTEPFGFVAIEAQLSGTPVICTDWGGFTETVLHGKTGYRCRTFEQFCWAAKNIENIQPIDCRRWSESNYNMKKIGKMYREYFESLILFSKEQKWFTNNDSRTQLDWLTKTYT